jgi:hypothetical protein
MWVACLKYHPTYGIPGTGIRGETLQEQIVDLGRGWEWWPSVVWQVIWTLDCKTAPFGLTIPGANIQSELTRLHGKVAPILLWRAWDIRDTMGWRTQTIGCCLSR